MQKIAMREAQRSWRNQCKDATNEEKTHTNFEKKSQQELRPSVGIAENNRFNTFPLRRCNE